MAIDGGSHSASKGSHIASVALTGSSYPSLAGQYVQLCANAGALVLYTSDAVKKNSAKINNRIFLTTLA